MGKFILSIDVGTMLSPDGLLDALRAVSRETLRPLIPAVQRHHANAQLCEDVWECEAVEPVTGGPQVYALHFRYAWEAQLGCSDVSYRDEERAHVHFTYAKGRVTFTWDEDADRSTVEEF